MIEDMFVRDDSEDATEGFDYYRAPDLGLKQYNKKGEEERF